MNDCLFCGIIKEIIPAEKVYEDTDFLAFLDINPVNIGHTLLVPKSHAENLYEIPDATLAHIAPVIKKLSVTIKSVMHADGVNIMMNNDRAAGQLIPHAHVHIIPRFSGDGFTHWKGNRKYENGEIAQTGESIRKSIL